jgi:hypothetical protein
VLVEFPLLGEVQVFAAGRMLDVGAPGSRPCWRRWRRWRRWLELMAEAIDETLPSQPQLRASLMACFDWGTAIAPDVSQSPADTDLGEPGPTPR